MEGDRKVNRRVRCAVRTAVEVSVGGWPGSEQEPRGRALGKFKGTDVWTAGKGGELEEGPG